MLQTWKEEEKKNKNVFHNGIRFCSTQNNQNCSSQTEYKTVWLLITCLNQKLDESKTRWIRMCALFEISSNNKLKLHTECAFNIPNVVQWIFFQIEIQCWECFHFPWFIFIGFDSVQIIVIICNMHVIIPCSEKNATICVNDVSHQFYSPSPNDELKCTTAKNMCFE